MTLAILTEKETPEELDGFTKHGLRHTSASSVNTWHAAPDIFIAEKLFGIKSVMGAAAHRGTSVEKGIVNIVAHGMDIDGAINSALLHYDKLTASLNSAKVAEERANIPAFINVGIGVLAQYGKPHFESKDQQNRIEIPFNNGNWGIPIIGFLDLVYPEHGLVIDIKTTNKAPSKFNPEHNRQAAIYRKTSGNSAVKFLYLTPTKHVWHECTDVDGTVNEIKDILRNQEAFLRAHTREELAAWVKVYQKMHGPEGRKRFDF
jgi:hypothetical protein